MSLIRKMNLILYMILQKAKTGTIMARKNIKWYQLTILYWMRVYLVSEALQLLD